GYSAAFDNKNVGSDKPVTVSGLALSGSEAANYTLTQPSGLTATITVRDLTVTAVADNKTYDGTDTASVALSSDKLSGDTITISSTSATFNDKNVGTGKTVTVSGISISGTDSTNYSLTSTSVTDSANITARDLTVTAVADDKIYDGDNIASVTLSSDKVVGDTLTLDSASATFDDKNVGTGKTVTVSSISISGTDSTNYSLTYTSATDSADITALAITVTAVTDSKVYDGDNTSDGTPTITSGSLASSDSAVWSQTFDNENVGTGKTLTPSGSVSDGNNGDNYAVTFVNDTSGEITALAITVTAVADNKTYDGTDTASVALSSDKLSGDTITISSTSATFNDKNVGTGKTVTVSGISISGTDSTNYSLTSTSVTDSANITARDLTVTAVADDKIYDGDNIASVTLSSDKVVGDTLTLDSTSATFDNKNVGTGKTVTISGISISGTDSTNYSLTSTSATDSANITAKTSSVTPNNKSKIVGAADPVLTGILNGFIVTDNITAVYSRENGETSGDYVISAVLSPAGALGNYSITYNTGIFTILDDPAPAVTDDPDDQTVIYGNDAVFSAAANGDPSPTIQWQVSTDSGS
ncbi:MAG: YDG domain-containing protein, partial [Dehalogenimonas sp.]|nr:YDG domain-containing protein [Dehalogenimonas sp.]